MTLMMMVLVMVLAIVLQMVFVMVMMMILVMVLIMVMILLMVLVMMLPNALAQDDGVVVLSDTVTGNQEQPKVLYIVPWQAAEDDTILKQPLATQLHSEVFEHVERQEHIRELKYLQTLSRSLDDGP